MNSQSKFDQIMNSQSSFDQYKCFYQYFHQNFVQQKNHFKLFNCLYDTIISGNTLGISIGENTLSKGEGVDVLRGAGGVLSSGGGGVLSGGVVSGGVVNTGKVGATALTTAATTQATTQDTSSMDVDLFVEKKMLILLLEMLNDFYQITIGDALLAQNAIKNSQNALDDNDTITNDDLMLNQLEMIHSILSLINHLCNHQEYLLNCKNILSIHSNQLIVQLPNLLSFSMRKLYDNWDL